MDNVIYEHLIVASTIKYKKPHHCDKHSKGGRAI